MLRITPYDTTFCDIDQWPADVDLISSALDAARPNDVERKNRVSYGRSARINDPSCDATRTALSRSSAEETQHRATRSALTSLIAAESTSDTNKRTGVVNAAPSSARPTPS